jgi:hypothetical protein
MFYCIFIVEIGTSYKAMLFLNTISYIYKCLSVFCNFTVFVCKMCYLPYLEYSTYFGKK